MHTSAPDAADLVPESDYGKGREVDWGHGENPLPTLVFGVDAVHEHLLPSWPSITTRVPGHIPSTSSFSLGVRTLVCLRTPGACSFIFTYLLHHKPTRHIFSSSTLCQKKKIKFQLAIPQSLFDGFDNPLIPPFQNGMPEISISSEQIRCPQKPSMSLKLPSLTPGWTFHLRPYNSTLSLTSVAHRRSSESRITKTIPHRNRPTDLEARPTQNSNSKPAAP